MKTFLLITILMAGRLYSETTYTFWASEDYTTSMPYQFTRWISGDNYVQIFKSPSTDNILSKFQFQSYGRNSSMFYIELYSWNQLENSIGSRISDEFAYFDRSSSDSVSMQFKTHSFDNININLTSNEYYALVFRNFESVMNYPYDLEFVSLQDQVEAYGKLYNGQYLSNLQEFAISPSRYGSYVDLTNQNALVSFNFVPEPSALSLLAVGLGGLAILRRRRS